MREFLNKWGMLFTIFLMLLIAFFVILTFTRTKGQNDADYKEKVDLLERERQAIINERNALKFVIDQHDNTIKALNKVDSLIILSISTYNKTLYEIKKQRETLSRFDKYSSDQLKKFFSDLR